MVSLVFLHLFEAADRDFLKLGVLVANAFKVKGLLRLMLLRLVEKAGFLFLAVGARG